MKLDWDAGHGPVTGPINTATAALAVGWGGHVAHMSPSLAAAAAGAGWLGTHIAGRRKGVTGATLGLRAAGWLGAGGWCSFAIAAGPWSQWGIGTLIVGALGLGAAMAGAHHVERKHEEEKTAAEAAARRATLDGKRQAIADEWEDRIVRVCTGSVAQIVGVEDWESGGGFSLDGECGPGGTKWKDIAQWADAMAADAKLPEGCGVEVGPGAHRGAFLMHVATVNRLIADADYPTDYSPLSLNAGVPLGVHRDGSRVAPVLRQMTTLAVGRKGAGKTNLLHLFLAGQARMTDNLAWVIDLNGGGLALPWLRAWHAAGRPGRPPIDWVADTPEKVLTMAKAMLRIAKARKPGYADLMIQANDDKLPVSPQVPGVMATGDEIAELYSPKARRDPMLREAGDVLVQVVELARAVAVNEINAALRATQDVVTEPQILKQSGLKIGMKSDEAEMSYLFGWSDRISPEDAPYVGCGFIKELDDPARPFLAYRIKPDRIADIVVATAHLHPELDDLSLRAAGEDYANRWNDTEHLFGTGPAPAPAPAAPVQQEQQPKRPGSGVTDGWGTEPASSDTQAAIDEAEAVRRTLRDAMDDASTRDPDLDQQFRDILTGGGAEWTKPETTPPAEPPVGEQGRKKREDPRKEIVFRIVARAGTGGIGPEAIRDVIAQQRPDVDPPHPTTIGRWLDADPRIHQPSYGRYAVRPDHA